MEQLRAEDPQRIGTYRLLGRLGTGGMGRVFLARSDRGRTVAVKLVRAELAAQEEFRSRFRREVLAARRVGGGWTAPVLDADTEADIPWVATGYVAGPSLQQVMKDYGPLPERSVTVLAAGLAHALADIHAAGLVHRDLKPSNVMITIDGPRVIDFGIARALETVADGSPTLTHTGAMVGSPAFMSPEQVRGDRVTPACDVFCLGSVLAYAATGLQPFGAASSGVHAQMFRIVQEPPDLEAVPEGLRALVTACLVKEPERRPSLAEVLELIGAPADEAPQGTRAGHVEPWLPGAIVAQLGRHAVQLLELEAEVEAAAEAGPGRDAVQTGPGAAAEAEPAVHAGAAARTAVTAQHASGAAGSGAGGGGAQEPPASTPAPTPTPTPTPASTPASASASASGGAAQEPARSSGRGRRGALVAILVLLAVIAGATTAYVVMQEKDRGDRANGAPPTGTGSPSATTATTPPTPQTSAPSPSATTPTSTPTTDEPSTPPTSTPTASATAPPVPVAAPDDLVGTWQSMVRTPPAIYDTRTLTVHENGSVELTGSRTNGTDTLYDCTWSMVVTDAGPPAKLSPSEVVSGKPAASCSKGNATTLTLVDSTHLMRDGVAGEKTPLTYEKVG